MKMCTVPDFDSNQGGEGSVSLQKLTNETEAHSKAPEEWPHGNPAIEKCIKKGEILVKQMRGSNKKAGELFNPPRASAQAEFSEDTDASPRYNIMRHDEDEDQYREWGIKNCLARYSLNDKWRKDGGSLGLVEWELPPYPVLWQNAFSVAEGAIFALHNVSPAGSVPANKTPRLSHWSDVAFVQWRNECHMYKSQTGSPASEIRYIYRCQIVNELTHSVIWSILDEQKRLMDNDTNYQSSYTVSTNTPEGKALLGTPNGAGVAYLLLQHKHELGIRTIDYIDIIPFYPEGINIFEASNFSLCFRVSRVEDQKAS